MAEHLTLNQKVVGSFPTAPIMDIHEIREMRDKCQEMARAKVMKIKRARRGRMSRNTYLGLISKYAAEYRRNVEQEILEADEAKWLAERQKQSEGDW